MKKFVRTMASVNTKMGSMMIRVIQKEKGRSRKKGSGGPSKTLFSSRSIWIIRRHILRPWMKLARKYNFVRLPKPKTPTAPDLANGSMSVIAEKSGKRIIRMVVRNDITGGKYREPYCGLKICSTGVVKMLQKLYTMLSMTFCN